jgi:hypothetical protein
MQLTVKVIEWNDGGDLPQDLIVDSIDIGGVVANTVATATELVSDDTSVEVAVTHAGYYPYTVTIDNVFKSDREIVILMAPIDTNLGSATYQKPHPRFFYFADPCSFNVTVYSASSFTGETTWYLGNALQSALDNASKFTYQAPAIGEYQIKMASKTYRTDPTTKLTTVAWLRQWANSEDVAYVFPDQAIGEGETGNTVISTNTDASDLVTYLASEELTNITVVEFRPTIDLVFSTPTDVLNDVNCYALYEEATVTPTVVLTRPLSDEALHTLTWQVIDPRGIEVVLTQSVFSLALPAASMAITFPLAELGTYTITATVDDIVCGTSFVQTDTLQTCNFAVVETTGTCGEFTLYNRSPSFSMDYDVSLVGGTLPSEYNGTLPTGEALTFTLVDIGIHLIELNWIDADEVEQTMTLVVNNFCVLWDCLAGYINETLCNPENLCDPCPDSLRLNQMVLFNMTYSMKLHKEYTFNNFYTTLDESKLAEFQTINALADKIRIFCEKLNCAGLCATFTHASKQFTFGVGSPSAKTCSTCGSTAGCGCSSSTSPCTTCS